MDDTTSKSSQGDPTPVTTPASQPPSTPGSGNIQGKMVPESDLIAVKKGSEKALADAQTTHEAQMTEVKGLFDTEHQKVLQGETRNTELEEQLKTHSDTAGKASELQTALDASNKAKETAESQVVDSKRTAISSKYSIPMESLQPKTLEQLNVLEEALQLVGKKGGTYDTGGVGTSPATLTPVEQCAAELQSIRDKK